MIPGMPSMPEINDEATDKKMKDMEAIICSIQRKKEAHFEICNAKRKERVAKGCGKTVADVNRLLKQFEQSQLMMKQLGNFNPTTGMPTQRPKQNNMFNPNRKKERHKKKKKR